MATTIDVTIPGKIHRRAGKPNQRLSRPPAIRQVRPATSEVVVLVIDSTSGKHTPPWLWVVSQFEISDPGAIRRCDT
jgi:hypothetical protein